MGSRGWLLACRQRTQGHAFDCRQLDIGTRGVSEAARRRDICLGGLMKEIGMEAPSIDFGELPAPINELLQRGVRAYRSDRELADTLFRQALAMAPRELATYY